MPPVNCRTEGCGAVIEFAYPEGGGKRGRMMPVDYYSAGDPRGNLEVWRDAAGRLRYRILGAGESPADGHNRGISHFATCTDSGRWRKGRTT